MRYFKAAAGGVVGAVLALLASQFLAGKPEVGGPGGIAGTSAGLEALALPMALGFIAGFLFVLPSLRRP
jgi:hypothetical protein